MKIADLESLQRFVKDQGIEILDLKYVDLYGRWHSLTLTARACEDGTFLKGVGFDGSSVKGFSTIESGDLVLLPDPSSAFRDPFWERPALSLLCDVVEADTRKPYGRCPRSLAKRAELFAASQGRCDRSLWGPEFEFYVFDGVELEIDPCALAARIRVDYPANRRIDVPEKCGYHQLPPLDRHADFRAAVTAQLERAGVRVYYHHHEVGMLGQCEIEVDRMPLRRAADVTMLVKHFVRATAVRQGRAATFMPKPVLGEPGSGMHFHQHLFHGGKPLFFDETGYAGLSSTALAYVAGILEHGRALCALTAPSINSYRRLTPGFEAPVNLFFSLANRSAAIRVPKYASSPEEKRIEFRTPDGTCNPYLAMSAQLMAGLDGIARNLNPTDMGFGPFDEDIFRWPPERRAQIRPLPESLPEALEALREDHDFLLNGGVFTESTIDTYVRLKEEEEIRPLAQWPHPFEMALYFDL